MRSSDCFDSQTSVLRRLPRRAAAGCRQMTNGKPWTTVLALASSALRRESRSGITVTTGQSFKSDMRTQW